MVRSMDLIAGLAVGLVAGAWVDRLRRRPVLVGADLGRALLLGLIPLAAIGGWLSLPLLLIVALSDGRADDVLRRRRSTRYLPSIVPRADLVRANGALAASSSVSEFLAFGSAGFLVQILTAPIAIFVDAVSFVISAVLLGSIRVKEAPPPAKADREPVLSEIAAGLRLVTSHPILRATTLASMAIAATWGVFSATWYLFAIDELGLDAAAIGIIAAVRRPQLALRRAAHRAHDASLRRRARSSSAACLIGMLGFFFVPLAPVGHAAGRDGVPDRPAARHRPGDDRLRHHRHVAPAVDRPRPQPGPGERHDHRRRAPRAARSRRSPVASSLSSSACAPRFSSGRWSACSASWPCGSRRSGASRRSRRSRPQAPPPTKRAG